MKNSTRFVSAILAASLCGAAFSACANEVKPPVMDVTTDAPITDAPATIAPVTDVTTDAYTTDAPVTTEAPETTDAPITETTDIFTTTDAITTEGAETTDTPTTSPSTTAAPATDAPSVTTEAPVTCEPVTEISETRITEAITGMPVVDSTDSPITTIEIQSNYTVLDNYLYAMQDGAILYKSAIFVTKENTAQTSNYVLENGLIKIQYSDGSSFTLPSEYYSEATRNNSEYLVSYVSDDISVIGITYYSNEQPYSMAWYAGEIVRIITVYDKGEYINVAEIDADLSPEASNCYVGATYYSKECGYAFIRAYNATLQTVYTIYKTTDSGKNFVPTEKKVTVNGGFSGVAFTDEFNGYLSLGGYSFAGSTHDGGATWSFCNGTETEFFDLPHYFDWMDMTFAYPMTPYFDKKHGVLPIQLHVNGEIYYAYMITYDNGMQWSFYDPKVN